MKRCRECGAPVARPCPFCGCSRVFATRDSEGLWAGQCDDCGAEGPWDATAADALERWDKRVCDERTD